MKIDIGVAVVIFAVLVFYLRLIILQRQRAKQLPRKQQGAAKTSQRAKNKSNAPDLTPKPAPRYTILSHKRRDQAIGIAGILLILTGILLNSGIVYIPSLQPFWWIPTSLGIVAFSWLFQL